MDLDVEKGLQRAADTEWKRNLFARLVAIFKLVILAIFVCVVCYFGLVYSVGLLIQHIDAIQTPMPNATYHYGEGICDAIKMPTHEAFVARMEEPDMVSGYKKIRCAAMNTAPNTFENIMQWLIDYATKFWIGMGYVPPTFKPTKYHVNRQILHSMAQDYMHCSGIPDLMGYSWAVADVSTIGIIMSRMKDANLNMNMKSDSHVLSI